MSSRLAELKAVVETIPEVGNLPEELTLELVLGTDAFHLHLSMQSRSPESILVADLDRIHSFLPEILHLRSEGFYRGLKASEG